MGILETLSSEGIEAKRKTAKEYCSPCPFCGGEDRFNIWPEEGNWWCRSCGEKGDHIEFLKKMKGMSYLEACEALNIPPKNNGKRSTFIKPAFESKKVYAIPPQNKAHEFFSALSKQLDAVDYLKSRGITGETCKRFMIGFAVHRGRRCVTFPHFHGGKLVNIKYRNIDPNCKRNERFDSEANAKTIFFNSDSIPKHDEVIIAEGEIDTISLIQAGMDNVVGVTRGAGDKLEPHQIDDLAGVKRILICFDPDEAGQAGAKSLAKRLGYKRCFNASMPTGYDLNDFFLRFSIDDFKTIISKATPFEVGGVITVNTAIDRLLHELSTKQPNGLQTQWPSVNKRIRGFMPGDLVIVTAPPKIGKTSWCLDISKHLTMSGTPVLFYCLEMRPERVIKKLIQSYYRSEELTTDNIRGAQKTFKELPLYLSHSFKKEKLEDVLDTIKQAIMRYDLKLVIFDNLHFVCRSLSNINEEIGNAIQGFKLLAEEMEIPIIVIAQPRKRETGSADEIMRADDIKYSNAIHADCDQMIILHRKRTVSKVNDFESGDFSGEESSFGPITLVRVEAHRYGSGGEAKLYFHGDYSRFDEADESCPF